MLKEKVSDLDGNEYSIVKIGNQVWMTEYLKTTRYRDGTSIANVSDVLAWTKISTGAYCNYYNKTDNVVNYGRLYNWYAVIDSRGICPAGWHVPTYSEWMTLDSCLKTNNDIMKLKGWWSYQLFGQSLLPIDYRNSNGKFQNENLLMQNNYGGWWTSTEFDFKNAWYYYVGFSSYFMIKDKTDKKCGYAVICIKD